MSRVKNIKDFTLKIQTDWEKEFDENFTTAIGGVLTLKNHDMLGYIVSRSVKAFIFGKLAQAQQEAVERVLQKVLEAIGKDERDAIDYTNKIWEVARNDARHELREKIKALQEKETIMMKQTHTSLPRSVYKIGKSSMSHTQTLNKLLDAGIRLTDFQVSAKDLDQQFERVGNILLSLGWLTQDYATGYQCSQCGAVHEVVAFNEKYFIGCDVDGDSGLEELSKDDLVIYRFTASKFFEWLQSQFSLQGNLEASDGKATLGQGMVNGNKRLFIFSHDGSPQAREKLYQNHPVNQAVIVYLNPTLDSHKGYDINLAEYLVMQDNSLSIDASSALGAIEDTIPQLAGDPQASSGYAVELKSKVEKLEDGPTYNVGH